MKPSERIREIYQAELETLHEDEQRLVEEHLKTRTFLMLRAVMACLDEEHEKKRQAAGYCDE